MAGRDLIPEAIGAVIEGVCVYGEGEAPIAGFATGAVLRYLLGRQDTARGTLRSQLERSGVTAADFKDTEQLAAAALRYMRAARDQAADENLRVLAQAMVGLARRYELWASDFLRYAEILAPLSRDELILIGTLMKEDQEFYTTPRPPKSGPRVWTAVRDHLIGGRVFPSAEHFEAIAAQAHDTGLPPSVD